MRLHMRPLLIATVVLLVLAPAVGAVSNGTVGAAGVGGPDSTGTHAQTATVTLTIAVQAPDGDPVTDAALTASWENGSATATTAGNGRAFVDVPAGATVEVSVDHPEYVRNAPFVVENASEDTVSITVRQRGSLTVSAEDDRGDAVADARVIVRADGAVVVNGRTNDDGRFTTGTIEQRSYSLTVVKQGYYRVNRDVDVGESSRESVALERGSVTFSFEVFDDRFDPPEPVENAQLTLETAGTFRTLQNGEATAQVPVNAELDLEVTKEGYETVSRTVSVEESARTVSVNLSRTPGLNVTVVNDRVLVGERNVVTVTDAYGDPVADARVLVDDEVVGRTGGEGTLTIRLEDAGNRTLVAETDDLTSDPRSIAVVRERTPTPTPTETATETPAPTTTPETTEPESSTSFPGFTPVSAVVAIAALAGAAVLAANRRDD
ncbi:carboxypeptidase regulatory-like domain-containing protein [Halobaculum halobium]|uniref:Carboxypeptidase regulatory-like domain-containing protein n=1 Tax=Halobaculum halobium TaxID=3032281 RepID=A0ABD5TA69_9EURY|nr:carboxypeptidase regulatory-like domain-containing protein [Halobaculum sp. SYNS20]